MNFSPIRWVAQVAATTGLASPGRVTLVRNSTGSLLLFRLFTVDLYTGDRTPEMFNPTDNLLLLFSRQQNPLDVIFRDLLKQSDGYVSYSLQSADWDYLTHGDYHLQIRRDSFSLRQFYPSAGYIKLTISPDLGEYL